MPAMVWCGGATLYELLDKPVYRLDKSAAATR